MTQRQGWHVYNYGGRGFAIHYYRESGERIKLFEAACGVDIFRGCDDMPLLRDAPEKACRNCLKVLRAAARAREAAKGKP